jgi:GNAT superfamily N-acetyltransferase
MTLPSPPPLAFEIRPATVTDSPEVLHLIRDLAEYEKMLDKCVITEAQLREQLFGARPAAEAWVAQSAAGGLVGFALFFTNFSTFLGKPGIYLEDLFVVPEARGHGVGLALMSRLASIAVERDYGRFEWSVLDWNTPSIAFYEQLGARLLPDWRTCRLTGEELRRVATLDR